jgi:hypothetical protein
MNLLSHQQLPKDGILVYSHNMLKAANVLPHYCHFLFGYSTGFDGLRTEEPGSGPNQNFPQNKDKIYVPI